VYVRENIAGNDCFKDEDSEQNPESKKMKEHMEESKRRLHRTKDRNRTDKDQ